MNHFFLKDQGPQPTTAQKTFQNDLIYWFDVLAADKVQKLVIYKEKDKSHNCVESFSSRSSPHLQPTLQNSSHTKRTRNTNKSIRVSYKSFNRINK